ncbi:MAG: hypothetical protein IJ496_04935 [Ruminococcus sp.]|nr:hypothetical protein [Ruminococcus sp.]
MTMTTILEALMMICFGFSWPMNLVKNYQSRTAKSMSLPFILLLIAGYTAGISAKIMLGQMNWVLVIYLINLAMILANLCVYFRNRSLDKAGFIPAAA